MSKTAVPLCVDDVTVFARALSKQLGDSSPSHLTLMNNVARAAGFQNVQHMRSVSAAAKRLEKPPVRRAANARWVERTLNQFDPTGKLIQWPSKRAVQTLALWGLWAAVPSKRSLSERGINEILEAEHTFQDPATLRRTMISCALLTRKPDGTDYRRVEQSPPVEALVLIEALSDRRKTRATNSTEAKNA